MADVIITPERFASFVDSNGQPTQRGAEYMESLTRQVNVSAMTTGSGSPEGVVIGIPGETYTDTTGAPGATQYVKLTGTGNTGWSL
jgi:hypothetical protein